MAQHWTRPGTWEVGVQTLLCTNMACDHGPARTYSPRHYRQPAGPPLSTRHALAYGLAACHVAATQEDI
jgi:hypothetical protein